MSLTVTVIRKPFTGTVAHNVLEHSTGGINVDASRVGAGTLKQSTAGKRTKWGISEGGCAYQKGTGATFTTEGRWPANVVLQHQPGCESLGHVSVKASSTDGGFTDTPARSWKNTSTKGINRIGYASADGTEMVESWNCESPCAVSSMTHEVARYFKTFSSLPQASGKS